MLILCEKCNKSHQDYQACNWKELRPKPDFDQLYPDTRPRRKSNHHEAAPTLPIHEKLQKDELRPENRERKRKYTYEKNPNPDQCVVCLKFQDRGPKMVERFVYEPTISPVTGETISRGRKIMHAKCWMLL